MLSLTRDAVTGVKASIFLWPMASPVATAFQAFPFHTSSAYFCTRCPSFSHSIVRARIERVIGLAKDTSRVAWCDPAGADQKVSGLLSGALSMLASHRQMIERQVDRIAATNSFAKHRLGVSGRHQIHIHQSRGPIDQPALVVEVSVGRAAS